MKTLITLLLATVFALSGCASVVEVALKDPQIQPILAEDIEVAIQLATKANDKAAVACYEALKKNYVGKQPEVITPKGVISAFELARLAARGAKQDIPEDVHNACAPLVLDAQKSIIHLKNLIPGL